MEQGRVCHGALSPVGNTGENGNDVFLYVRTAEEHLLSPGGRVGGCKRNDSYIPAAIASAALDSDMQAEAACLDFVDAYSPGGNLPTAK